MRGKHFKRIHTVLDMVGYRHPKFSIQEVLEIAIALNALGIAIQNELSYPIFGFGRYIEIM